MKTKLLLAALLSWASLCFSQVVFSNANLRLAPDAQIQENTLQESFSRLDKSRIPNGLLLDAAVESIDLKKFDGTLPDSSHTSAKAVTDIYNTLVMSRLHASAQMEKTPVDFSTEWKNAQAPDIVPLGGVFYWYSQFLETTRLTAKTTGDPSKELKNNIAN